MTDNAPEAALTTDEQDALTAAVSAALNYWGYDAGLGLADFKAAEAITHTTNAASSPGGLFAAVERILAARLAERGNETTEALAKAYDGGWNACFDYMRASYDAPEDPPNPYGERP